MRILVLTPSLPLPAMWGFNIRVFNILRELATRNSVSLLCYGDPRADADSIRQLGEICDHVYVVPHVHRSPAQRRLEQAATTLSFRSFHLHRFVTDAMQAQLGQVLRGGGYDAVQVESSAMAMFDFGRTPVILDEHNLEFELLRRSNTVERSPLRRLFGSIESRKVEREEDSLWRRVAGCVVTSDREQVIVDLAAPGVPTEVVPNGVALEHFRPRGTAVAEGSIVFTGLMTYRPNADGVRHFVTQILPRIRRTRPDAVFTAVGWGLPADVRPLLGNGVIHTGRVDDIRPYLAKAAVVVVPLRIGSGTRLKVLEALAMGKAVVTTSIGCEGLAVEHERHVLIADDPVEFATAVLRLLADRDEAAGLGRRGRELVERLYGWDAVAARLASFHQSLLGNRSLLAPSAVGAV